MSDLLDHALEQQPAGVGVQRHGHAAGRQRAVEGRKELDLVAHEEADVAGASEVLEQRVAEAVGEDLRLAEA